MVDGILCQTPEDILAFKEKLGREKDQEDIRKLKEYIASQKK